MTAPPVVVFNKLPDAMLATVSEVVVALVKMAPVAFKKELVALVRMEFVAKKLVEVALVEVEKRAFKRKMVEDAVA